MEEVQPGFRAFVARMFGDEGRAWLASLPAVIEEVAATWRLELGVELPGGHLSYVCEATTADGASAVLKVGPPWPRGRDEITALRMWEGRGAPLLLRSDESQHALLLERIAPGTHPDPGEPTEVARVLQAIHLQAPGGLPPLGETVERRLMWASDQGRASKEKLAWAMATLAELERTAPPAVLLHGDFDERNLLVCARRGLCAIDPLTCVGDPAYDAAYWVHANRRKGRRARLEAIVAATGLPRDRVRDWAGIVGVHG
jgi:streptomycin 6-kinase